MAGGARSSTIKPAARRLRVLVSHHFWAHYRSAVVAELARNGRHDYRFVGDDHDPANAGIRAADVERLAPGRFRRLKAVALLGGRVLWQRGMIGAALARDVDAVVLLGHYGHASTWLAAALARLAGKRVLFWTHGYTREDHGAKRLIRKCFYRIPHALMFYGHYGKNVAVTRVGFAPERIHVLYNSLDLDAQRAAVRDVTRDELAALRRELFGDADVPVVACVIRLLASRRLDLVIEGAARLKARGRPVNVLLVGDGPERANLEALAAARGVNVRFYGACYDEPTLARLTMAANATVCPGPVGLTAIQSLAFGTPVITNDDWPTQMPEFEAILAGRTGDFFRAGDADALADAIGRWTQTTWPAPGVAEACRAIVDKVWNPAMQRRAIDRAVGGAPADDLFASREPDVAASMPDTKEASCSAA